MLVDGRPVPGPLFDFGLYFFHNAQNLIDWGSGPYFYVPKMEHHREARLWNDVFNLAQDELGVPRGTIKATALLETFPAVFEMDEILYELRDHSAGLNAGRWDYIFSYIKTFRNREGFVLPDRVKVTMPVPFMRAYTQLLIKTCHRRGAHAIGGMAAQIPIKDDPEANEQAFAKVREDKEREANDGHDGTWVAHPGLVPVAKEVFDEKMPQANQLDKLREDVNVAAAELSRTQVWQWIHHSEGVLEDGTEVTEDLFRKFLSEELEKIPEFVDPVRTKYDRFEEAAKLFDRISTDDDVVRLRGSIRIEHTLARMGAGRLWELMHTRDYVASLGALTGNQAVQQVKAGLDSIYLSGGQGAADANLAGQMYPDQTLYPANSGPQLV